MLVIPSVSIGNVPQLALDLVIHTYGFQLVNSLDDEVLAPFVGPLDYVQGAPQPQDIATAMQLFQLNDDFILQIRSPPLPGQKQKFVNSVRDQIPELAAKGTIIVGSANAGARLNSAGTNSEISILSSPQPLQESGFVNEALQTFSNSRALISFVYEGDNLADALQMAQRIVLDLGLPPMKFRQPVSWNRLYGKEPPLGIEEGIYT